MRRQAAQRPPMQKPNGPKLDGLIHSDPAIMMGKPVIAGTRIPVELILEKLAAGETTRQILKAHPRLTQAAIRAALDFASKAIRADVVYPVIPKRK